MFLILKARDIAHGKEATPNQVHNKESWGAPEKADYRTGSQKAMSALGQGIKKGAGLVGQGFKKAAQAIGMTKKPPQTPLQKAASLVGKKGTAQKPEQGIPFAADSTPETGTQPTTQPKSTGNDLPLINQLRAQTGKKPIKNLSQGTGSDEPFVAIGKDPKWKVGGKAVKYHGVEGLVPIDKNDKKGYYLLQKVSPSGEIETFKHNWKLGGLQKVQPGSGEIK
jgi:hypothetical protein